MTQISFVEIVIRGDDGRNWRERWEPARNGPAPTMLMAMRDPKTGEAVSQHGFWLKSREEVMG